MEMGFFFKIGEEKSKQDEGWSVWQMHDDQLDNGMDSNWMHACSDAGHSKHTTPQIKHTEEWTG